MPLENARTGKQYSLLLFLCRLKNIYITIISILNEYSALIKSCQNVSKAFSLTLFEKAFLAQGSVPNKVLGINCFLKYVHVSLLFACCYISEGLAGMAIVGGAALAIGGIIGLGVALAKK